MKKLFIILCLLTISYFTQAQNKGNYYVKNDTDSTYSLDSRSILFPKTNLDTSKSLYAVVVSITVDSSGNVIKANFNKHGSTTNDTSLINFAIKEAYKAKFSKAKIIEEKGSMTFKFRTIPKN